MRDDAVDAAWTLDQCGSVLTQTGVDLLDQQCDARPRRTKSARHPFVRRLSACAQHADYEYLGPNLPAVHSRPSARWSKDWGMGRLAWEVR